MALFLAILFLAIASSAQVQGMWNFGCTESFPEGADVVRCPDYEKIISCLNNASASLAEGPTKSMVSNMIQHEIKYYENLNLHTSCPALTNNGTCLEHEMRKCIVAKIEGPGYTKMCQNIEHSYNCFTNLTGICPTAQVLHQSVSSQARHMKSCQSGWFKSRVEAEKCMPKIRNCSHELLSLMRERNFEAACEKVESSSACLDQIEGECDKYTNQVKSQFGKTAERCESGLLTGNCSYIAIEKCPSEHLGFRFNKFHGKRDTHHSSFWNIFKNIDLCPEEDVAAAKKCLEDLRPQCVSKQQQDYHQMTLHSIKSWCPVQE